MSTITDFLRKKINLVRYGSVYLPDTSPPVNMTKILRNPQNILIMPYNRLGTILLATRVFKSFREHYDSARITVAVNNTWSMRTGRRADNFMDTQSKQVTPCR